MKVSEFKAFIEGIEEAFYSGSPSIRQWEKIKEKINKLEDAEVKRVEWPQWSKPTVVDLEYQSSS